MLGGQYGHASGSSTEPQEGFLPGGGEVREPGSLAEPDPQRPTLLRTSEEPRGMPFGGQDRRNPRSAG